MKPGVGGTRSPDSTSNPSHIERGGAGQSPRCSEMPRRTRVWQGDTFQLFVGELGHPCFSNIPVTDRWRFSVTCAQVHRGGTWAQGMGDAARGDSKIGNHHCRDDGVGRHFPQQLLMPSNANRGGLSILRIVGWVLSLNLMASHRRNGPRAPERGYSRTCGRSRPRQRRKYDSVGLRINEDISSSAMYINW